MPKLSVDEVYDIVRTITQEAGFIDRNLEWRDARELVYQQRHVEFPGVDMETEYLTPELLEFADKYTARFIGSPFSIDVSAQGEGRKAFEKAQALENLDYRLVNRWWQQKVFNGPVHDAAGVTGEGWVHLTLNRAVLPIVPVRGDQEDDEAFLRRGKEVLDEFATGERADLFVVEPIREPETIYYIPDRSVIFMRMEVPLPLLQRQYMQSGAGGLYGTKGKGKGVEKSRGLYTITSLEGGVDQSSFNRGLWSETACLYVVEDGDYIYHLLEDDVESGQAGGRYKSLHNLGCYKNVFGAPGFVDIRARETNHASPQFSVHPLTHGAISIAPNLNIMSTIIYSAGILGEMQRITLEPLPGPEAALERQNNKNLDIELVGNRVVKFPDGYRAVQPNIGVNADTLNAHAQLEAKMVQLGFPLSIGQPEESDASSGYQQAVQRDSASSLLDPFLANFAGMIGRLLDLKDVGIKTLDVPFTFRNFEATDEMGRVSRPVMSELTISPEDIVEVDRQVRFDSLTQYARQAKIELGLSLLEKGRITEDMFYRDYMGVDDPLKLKRQRYIEQCLQLAEQYALKTVAALYGTVTGTVADEAMATSGMEPLLQLGMGPQQGQPLSSPTGAITTSNGAGGSVPLQPAPNDMAEMGSVGEAAQYG